MGTTSSTDKSNDTTQEDTSRPRHRISSPGHKIKSKRKLNVKLSGQSKRTEIKNVDKYDSECVSEQRQNSHVVTRRLTSLDRQRQCPICFESAYKNPKLLPCCHTFCLPCLQDHTRSKQFEDALVCPICRAKIYIQEGVKGFMENYFVQADSRIKCDICRDENGDRECNSCEKFICIKCFKRHKCNKSTLKISLFDSSSSSNSESDSDSSSVHSDASVPWSFTRPTGTWTKVILNEEIKFHMEDDTNCISVVPVSHNEAWVLKGTAESCSLVLYDTTGYCKRSIQLPSIALGFTVENAGSLLVCFTEEAVVRRYSGTEPNVIVSDSVFHPHGIALFRNDCIVITGFEKRNMDEISMGCVKFISVSGEDRSNFKTGYDNIPFMVCVLNNDLLCFAYPENNCVDVRLEDGNVVGKYRGNDSEEHSSFAPVALCVGHYCFKPVIFVADGYSDTIHILSYAAEFVGLVLKSRLSRSSSFGELGGIGVDCNDKLWVGQRDDNVISILSICKYCNIME